MRYKGLGKEGDAWVGKDQVTAEQIAGYMCEAGCTATARIHRWLVFEFKTVQCSFERFRTAGPRSEPL